MQNLHSHVKFAQYNRTSYTLVFATDLIMTSIIEHQSIGTLFACVFKETLSERRWRLMAQELRRKSIHLLGLVVPIAYLLTEKPTALTLVGIFTGIALLIELLKALFPPFLGLFVRIFSPMLRSHERKGGLTGATYYLIGSLLCILIFQKNLAIVCICFLILGDLFAAVIGKQWGRTKLFDHKSLEGSLACFVVCALIALMRFHPIIALTGAIVATLIELLPIGLDDNLTMPLISGIVMQMMLNHFEW